MADRVRANPGRPRAGSERLSREAILDVALHVVDTEGVEAMTMRRLATELGVNPMSIYHHLPSKAAVLAGLVDRVFAGVDPPVNDGGTWQDQLRRAADAYRATLRAHPNLALQILGDTATVATIVVTTAEPFYAALERAGLAPRTIVEAADTMVDFVHGFVLGEAANASSTFDVAPDLVARVRSLPEGAAPALTRTVDALGEDGLHYDFDGGFAVGIDILIAGIEAMASR